VVNAQEDSMLKIERQGKGFLIQAVDVGLGSWKSVVRDVKALTLAVDHYYSADHAMGMPDCPLCEEEMRDQKPPSIPEESP
jgi:hypothetical protein